MEEVKQLINLLLVLLTVATVVNILFCIFAIVVEPDSSQSYKKRIRNAVIFLVIALTSTGLVNAISSYYS